MRVPSRRSVAHIEGYAGRLTVVASLASIAVLAGCASRSADLDHPTTPSRAPAAYPIVVTRTGGVAGFSDTLTLTADGRVRWVGKGGAARSCRLTPAATARVDGATAALVWTRSPTAPGHPDELSLDITAPGRGPSPLPDGHPLAALLTALAAGEPTPECTAEPGGAT